MSSSVQSMLEELVRVDRKLDAVIEHAFSKASEVAHLNAELWEQAEQEAEELSEYEVELMRAQILAHERTPEWQRVVDRIDCGDLTWRQVVVGYYSRRKDPEVRAAFDSLRKVPQLSLEQIGTIAAEVRKRFEPDEVAKSESIAPNPFGIVRRRRR